MIVHHKHCLLIGLLIDIDDDEFNVPISSKYYSGFNKESVYWYKHHINVILNYKTIADPYDRSANLDEILILLLIGMN